MSDNVIAESVIPFPEHESLSIIINGGLSVITSTYIKKNDNNFFKDTFIWTGEQKFDKRDYILH